MRKRTTVANNITAGSLDAFQGDDAVLIGSRLAERLGLTVGDRITLISPTGNVTAFGTVPRMRAYRVAGTFNGMFEYDLSFVFMPLEAAQTYFRMPDAVTTLEIFVDQPDKAVAVGSAVRGVIDDAGKVYDWQRANASFFNAIQVERAT